MINQISQRNYSLLLILMLVEDESISGDWLIVLIEKASQPLTTEIGDAAFRAIEHGWDIDALLLFLF